MHKIALLLTAFRAVSPSMTIQGAHTFLLVAMNEGKSLIEIANLSGFKYPTVSRNILDLGERNRKRQPGLGLVITVNDPNEMRKKQVRLTDKGRTLLNQLTNIMKV